VVEEVRGELRRRRIPTTRRCRRIMIEIRAAIVADLLAREVDSSASGRRPDQYRSRSTGSTSMSPISTSRFTRDPSADPADRGGRHDAGIRCRCAARWPGAVLLLALLGLGLDELSMNARDPEGEADPRKSVAYEARS